MPFQPGKSGNPAGRPKRDPFTPTDYSVREAIKRVVKSRPDLLEDTIERLLRGSRSSLGMLELAAKLNRELIAEEQGNRIAIVFTGGIDINKLKSVEAKVIDVPRAEMQSLSDIAGANTARQTEEVLQQDVLVQSEPRTQETAGPV